MKTENFFGNSVHPLEKSDGMKIVLEELLSPVLVEGGLKKKKKKRQGPASWQHTIPVLPLPMIPWLLSSASVARRKYYLQVPVHDIMLVNVIHTLQYLMNTVAAK